MASTVSVRDGRQQYQGLQKCRDRPGKRRRLESEERREDRRSILDGKGEDAGNRGVQRHPDAAALVPILVEAVALRALDDHYDVDRETGGKRGEVGGRVRRIPDGGVEQPIDADEIQRCRRREHDHWRGREERDGVQPAMLAQARRGGGEVENGKRDDREGQRSGEPRKNRHQAVESWRQHPFDPEQRAASANRAEREGNDRQLGGEIAAAQEEQRERGQREDHDLDEHSRPAAGRRPCLARPVVLAPRGHRLASHVHRNRRAKVRWSRDDRLNRRRAGRMALHEPDLDHRVHHRQQQDGGGDPELRGKTVEGDAIARIHGWD
jgi:hypothetical protein